jgi:hypothetical protein
VLRFQLGYEVKPQTSVAMPAYEGTLDLQSATVPGTVKTSVAGPSPGNR